MWTRKVSVRTMPRWTGRALRWLLGLALVAVVLAQSEWSGVSNVASISAPELGVWISLNLLVLILLGARWQVLLDGLGAVAPLFHLTLHRLAGFGVSFLTPGPQFGGEPLQVLLLTRREGIPSGPALGSVALDKTLDLLASFAFLALGALCLSQRGLTGIDRDLWLGAIPLFPSLLIVAYLIALSAGSRPLTAMVRRVLSQRLVEVRSAVTSAEGRVAALLREKPGVLGKALAISAGAWLLQVVEFWWMLRLVGADTTPLVAVSLLTLVRLAFLLPLPGGLGAVEAALVIGAPALGLPGHVGLAAAFMIRARDFSLALSGVAWGLRAIGRKGPADVRGTPAFHPQSVRAALRSSPRGAQRRDRSGRPVPAPPSLR